MDSSEEFSWDLIKDKSCLSVVIYFGMIDFSLKSVLKKSDHRCTTLKAGKDLILIVVTSVTGLRHVLAMGLLVQRKLYMKSMSHKADLSFGFCGAGVFTPHTQNSTTLPPPPLLAPKASSESCHQFEILSSSQIHPFQQGKEGSPVRYRVSDASRAKAQESCLPIICCPHTVAEQEWPWPLPPSEVAPETVAGRRGHPDLVRFWRNFSLLVQWISKLILRRMFYQTLDRL